MIRGIFAGAVVFCFLLFLENAEADLIHGKDYQSPNGDQVVRVNSSGQITQTLQAGEDQTNGVMKTEQQFSYCAGIVADGQCGSPARFLHSVTCAGDDPAATAGSMAIRDATAAGAGTIIQNVNFAGAYFAPVTMIFDIVLTTGLYLDFTTTADVECSASYR
jgi:hypothetical protein